MTLHLVYNAADVDTRFWVSGSSAARSIYCTGGPGGEAPIGRLTIPNPRRSILQARALAAAKLGVQPEEIAVADYLKVYV